MGWYSKDELFALGLRNIGENVFVSKKISLYNVDDIIIGDNVRIDDFCYIRGKVRIKNHVHLATATTLFGGCEGITMDDFSSLGPRGIILADSDDYSGNSLTNGTIPSEYKNITSQPVYIGKHSIIGAGAVVLPGVTIAEGCSVGAMSLVIKSTEPWTINVGIPSKAIKNRSKNLLELEKQFNDLRCESK